jgi:hypothetical protein
LLLRCKPGVFPMLFRALFWIGIVLVFMPREPGPRTDRSSAGTTADATLVLGDLHDSLLSRLARIKSDIEFDQRARGALF